MIRFVSSLIADADFLMDFAADTRLAFFEFTPCRRHSFRVIKMLMLHLMLRAYALRRFCLSMLMFSLIFQLMMPCCCFLMLILLLTMPP